MCLEHHICVCYDLNIIRISHGLSRSEQVKWEKHGIRNPTGVVCWVSAFPAVCTLHPPPSCSALQDPRPFTWIWPLGCALAGREGEEGGQGICSLWDFLCPSPKGNYSFSHSTCSEQFCPHLPPLVPCSWDNDGCVDTSLELLLHTCHAFVTSPFLNKRTSPWIASSGVCHVFSTGTLPSSNPSLCYSLDLGPWPVSLTSLRLSIFTCKTDKPESQAQMSGTRQVSQTSEVGVCLTWDLSLVPSLAVPEKQAFWFV